MDPRRPGRRGGDSARRSPSRLRGRYR